MMAVSRSSGFCRLSNGSRTMNIEAKLELLACSRNDMPAKATVCATPGRFVGDLLDLGHGLLGPLQRRRVGQLDVDDQPALVLLRDEAGRGLLKHPVGQGEQAAVDQQDDRAYAQQACRPTSRSPTDMRSKQWLKPRKNQPRTAFTGRMMNQPTTPPGQRAGQEDKQR